MLRDPYCPVSPLVLDAKAGHIAEPPKKRVASTSDHVPPPMLRAVVDPSIIILAMDRQVKRSCEPSVKLGSIFDRIKVRKALNH